MERFVKPAVPIVVVLLLLGIFGNGPHAAPLMIFGVSFVCGIVLWFGWPWVRRNVIAKWIGILLAAYLGLVLALFALGVALGLGLVLLVLFLFALPFLVYDLFFRQPRKGRFARARAERRNVPL